LKKEELHRKNRKRRGFKTVAVVGYTNVGKSTLLKKLTGKDVLIRDMPFATLDVRTGALLLDGQKVLISDTVGFIKNLPHQLIASFRATLSEVKEADVLLIVFDASSGKVREELESVKEVLRKLGSWEKPKIFVANKIDRLIDAEEEKGELFHVVAGQIPTEKPEVVFVSALKGWGLDELKEKLKEKISTFAQ